MNSLAGRLTARLADSDEAYDDSLIDEINRRINPPRPLSSSDVYVRAMYIVSDQVNSQGGRFDEPELGRLADLMIDSPVMVGHRRDSLPVARNFKADKVVVDGRPWVKTYFYWLKRADGAEALKNNIDGGIYKEGSISFLFGRPECSVCGQDIRLCHHVPFEEYDTVQGKQMAHFVYRDVERVLETSLVFRGAIPDTRITDDLSPEDESMQAVLFTKAPEKIESLSSGFGRAAIRFIKSDRWTAEQIGTMVALYPHQPGLAVRFRMAGEGGDVESNRLLPEAVRSYISEKFDRLMPVDSVIDILIYATRGNERLDGAGLMQIIDTGQNLHRLRFRLCDVLKLRGEELAGKTFSERIKKIESLSTGKQESIEILSIMESRGGGDSTAEVKEKSGRYRYGLEVLAEEKGGRLVRYIVSEREQIPVVVEGIAIKSRAHVSCRIKALDGSFTEQRLSCPRHPGMEKGTLALVYPLSKGGETTHLAWHDVLPGIDPEQVIVSPKPNDEVGSVRIRRGDSLMTLYYPGNDGWQQANVYHFSQRLFAAGRMFVADVAAVDESEVRGHSGESIPLQSRACAGKMTRLTIGKSQFGEEGSTVFCLRPVLIDGRERYLFYRAGVNHPQGGL